MDVALWIAVPGSVVAVAAMLYVAVAAAGRDRRRIASLVPGERELGRVPVDRVQRLERESHGTNALTLPAITEIRVTDRRLHLHGRAGPLAFINLEPAPDGAAAPLPGPDEQGLVVVAQRTDLAADFDRVTLPVHGTCGRRTITRYLIQLADGHALARLVRGEPG